MLHNKLANDVNCISSYGDTIGSTSAFAGGVVAFCFFPFPVHQHIFGIFWAPLVPSRNGREEEVTTVASSFYYWDSFFIGIDIEGLLWIVLSTLPFTKTLGGVFMIHGGLIPGV